MNQNTNSLGETRHTFRPKMANIGAGAVIGLLLLFGGLAIAISFARAHHPVPQGIGDTIGIYVLMFCAV